MESSLRDQVKSALESYTERRANKELSINTCSKISYGTAGFRGDAAKIEHIFFNVGLISALKCLKSKANIGIMITASHNPIQDNGVKLIESNGEMLEQDWEPIVELFCNTHDRDLMLNQLDDLVTQQAIETRSSQSYQVFIGMDSRPSSEALATLVKQGLDSWAPLVRYIDYGLLTTPALHYLVGEFNRLSINELPLRSYYDKLVSGLVQIFSEPPKASEYYNADQLVIDCANGVGSETMQYLCKNEKFSQFLPVKLINTGDGILNQSCGADHVKTKKIPPSGAQDTSLRYAALDGDADRVVYFYLDQDLEGGDQKMRLNLLDGDKIMALYALYLQDVLKEANLDSKLTIGAVQTAYANGASTDYMSSNLGLRVSCVDTGVKNLHREALNYDIGIYFEANGHGTIWVSDKARSLIREESEADTSDLKKLLSILNNYTGDAISDILIVETILRHYDWGVERWFQLYSDRPNALIKVPVVNRNLIKTTNAGRTCLAPASLQKSIDSLVETLGQQARCFVRPSGTEDVARIYAESEDQESAEKLANLVSEELVKALNTV